ncbi:hypothetical protein LIER_21571 [Lithospermum erythrorhizon]|uniref:Reverse transcriptase RNase H-like domain-containing protein n=1 Tax=Lithospermum erythrorhizon TaxID=34254 RepID=A0AAV3QU64_LITER
MRGVETRYPLIEKLIYALIVALLKLQTYFDAHLVEVIMDQSLQKILENPNRFGRIVKCSIELSEFGLQYKPRTSIKAQALADFMVECTHDSGEETPELINLIEDS